MGMDDWPPDVPHTQKVYLIAKLFWEVGKREKGKKKQREGSTLSVANSIEKKMSARPLSVSQALA